MRKNTKTVVCGRCGDRLNRQSAKRGAFGYSHLCPTCYARLGGANTAIEDFVKA